MGDEGKTVGASWGYSTSACMDRWERVVLATSEDTVGGEVGIVDQIDRGMSTGTFVQGLWGDTND